MKRGKYKQSTEGVIKLINKRGEIVVIRNYRSITERKDYIEAWKRYYGQQFNKLALEISPELDEELLLKELEAEIPKEAIMEEISL